MHKLKDFKALVGKELSASLGDDHSVKIKVDAVEALPKPETDDETVRKDPFRVNFSTAVDCRLPSGIVKLSGSGIDSEVGIECCSEPNGDDDRIPYEAIFA